MSGFWGGRVSSIRPLDISGIQWLTSRLKTLDERDIGRRVCEFILYTGAHPRMVSNPLRYNFSLGADGLATWHRPKNAKFAVVPIAPAVRKWMPEFVRFLDERRYHPVYVNEIVKKTGWAIGMPGLTPRCLRHTLGYIVWLETRDINQVVTALACDAETALNYIKLDTTGWRKGVLETGWAHG